MTRESRMSAHSWNSYKNESLYARFQSCQIAWEGRGSRTLDEVVIHPEFMSKLSEAVGHVTKRPPERASEDLMQDVSIRVLEYFRRTGARSWTDRGEDDFLGWIWVICYREACRMIKRNRDLPDSAFFIEDASSSLIPDSLYRDAMVTTFRTIRSFDKSRQRVMRQWLLGWSCEMSAEKLKISKNWVHKIRTEGKETIMRELQELAGTYF